MNMNISGPVHYAVAGDLVICSGVCDRRKTPRRGTIRMAGGLALVAALLSGCATRSDFTAISGKNVNLASMKIDRKLAKGKVKGEDCQHIISFIPTGGPPTLSEALDQALESQHANLMLDAVTKYHWFYIPYIYGRACWNVEGVAYDTYQ